MQQSENRPPKMVYHPPHLVVYGKVREITQAKQVNTKHTDGSNIAGSNKS
jgi:hypothetical protein